MSDQNPMSVSDMRIAVERARITLRNADNCVGDMARLIAGRLRSAMSLAIF